MKPRLRHAPALALLLAGAAGAADLKEAGRALTARFYAGETAAIWQQMTGPMQEALGSAAGLAAFRGQVDEQLGAEEAVLDERVEPSGGFEVYLRTARFAKSNRSILVQWTFDAEGRVAGFFVRPAATEAPSRYLDYETKTALSLPFDGEWYVFWGGRSLAENYHAVSIDQRFAYDFLVYEGGRSHRGDGRRVEEYHCWGRPILAPAEGKVAVAVDGLPDQAPGAMDREHPPGNHVILDHGNGEFSLLAHLQNGSVAVKKGGRVGAGQRLGLCGNSGNTSEPHLHYHLQTTSEFGRGEGLPAAFRDYLRDGQPVERGEPRRGETVAPRKREEQSESRPQNLIAPGLSSRAVSGVSGSPRLPGPSHRRPALAGGTFLHPAPCLSSPVVAERRPS
jgi:hypothetical protein